MRVGLFTDVYPPYVNGVSTSVLMLKRSLEKLGHQVFVVTVNNENLKYKYEENGTIIRIPGLPIGIYDYRLSGIYPLRALKQIKKWHLDVIHSHTEFGVGTFARIIAKQYHIPLVHTYHTMYEDYIHYITKGHFDGASKKIVEYLTLFYCDQTISELVVPTKKTYDLFKEKYKVNRNIYVVPTGIEVEKFYQENLDSNEIEALKKSLGLTSDDFVLMYLGRIAAEKSIDYLLAIQKRLVKKIPNLKMLIVGDGPELEKHKRATDAASFKNSVIFTGKVPLGEVAKYYQLGNIFLTASTTETQGLTVIEAMASGQPVVAIDDESFRNTIVPGLNGYLFTKKSECLKIVMDLYHDPEKLKHLSTQARANASMYSSRYYGERITSVYKIAINNYGMKKKSIFDYLKKVVRKK